jgi:excinuclease UvrABC nuclease subunit
MEEILSRRTIAALKEEDPWPDLIIIDGGKGQLSTAMAAIQNTKDKVQNGEFINSPPLERREKNQTKKGGGYKKESSQVGIHSELLTPPVISLAKRIEEVFLPENSEPILLEK